MKNLRSKRVLVTGGAQGIGLCMARHFAARGAHVLLTDVNEDGLRDSVKQLTEAGHSAEGHRLDVTNSAQIQSARDEIESDGGPVDVLINNAGVVFGGAFLDVPLERHELTYRINTMGVVAVAHAFLPGMIRQPSAHLVNIGSASGMIGLPFGATYASSKWSVIGFSESIRLELKQLGHAHVQVTTVNPAYIRTGMFDGVSEPRGLPMLDPEDLSEKVVRAVESGKPWVAEPTLVKFLPLVSGIIPRALRDRFMWWSGVSSSMARWRGHAGGPQDLED